VGDQDSKTRQQRDLSALLQEGTRLLQTSRNPDLLSNAVAEGAMRLTGADRSTLYQGAAGTISKIVHVRHDAEGAIETLEPASPLVPLPGIPGFVARSLRAYLTMDKQLDPISGGLEESRSELAVPLLTGPGDLVGVLSVESREPRAFGDEQMRLLEVFAGQAAMVLETAGQYARAERERRRFELLLQAGRELGEMTDPARLMDAYGVVLRTAVEQCDSPATLRRFDSATGRLVLARSMGVEGPLPEAVSLSVTQERRTVVIADLESPSPDLGDVRTAASGDRSFLVAPIAFEGTYYGNLALHHPQADHFRDTDVELVEGLCQQLALTIHRLERAQAIQEAQQKDVEDQAMSWLGRQTYEITHRLKNDLGLIPTSLRKIRKALAATGMDEPTVERHLADIEAGVKAALGLSVSLSERLTAQAPRGEASDVPARDLIEEALSSLRLPPEESRIRLDLNLAADLGWVHSVPSQITSALLNLLVNAIEAMPEGGTLSVGAANEGPHLKIWVHDTGHGIEQENLEKIFRLHYSTKKRSSAGWGLASARRNVEENGGRIAVESALGQGSTFTIVLPRAERDAHG